MIQTVASPATESKPAPVEQVTFVKAYRLMVLARTFDEKFASLYRGGKIHGGVFLGRGQEALSVAVGLSLRRGDVYAPLIRDAAGRFALARRSWTLPAPAWGRLWDRCAGGTATCIGAGRARGTWP